MAQEETNNALLFKKYLRTWDDFVIILTFLVLSIIVGLGFIWFQSSGRVTAALWAMACLAAGGIVGFLFGIPRVLQDNNAAVVKTVNGAGDNKENAEPSRTTQSNYRMQVNTNLEQISDWLTKIIVGLGLVELRRVPEFLNSLSLFFGQGLNESPQARVIAAAIIVYFVTIGFIGAYLMTRIYLAAAFSRADRETQDTTNVAGYELTLKEAHEQLRKIVTDVQYEVAGIQTGVETTAAPEERSARSEKLKVKSILWVDDHPKDNSMDVDSIKKLGIDVVQVLSTGEALKIIEVRTFDLIISDMVRSEEGETNPRAGIDLIKAVRAKNINTPIIIYCSAEAAAKYKDEAIEASAIEVTSSSTVLMKALQIEV